MKKFALLLGLMVSSLAFANPTVLTAKDLGWTIRFDAPPSRRIQEESTASTYHYAGTAGTFSLSLSIEPPSCKGGSASEDQLQCFLGKIEMVPGLVKQTVKVNRLPNALQVSYLAYARLDDVAVKTMHTHLLFAQKDKWGDLHASVVRPDNGAIAMLLGLGDGFNFITD